MKTAFKILKEKYLLIENDKTCEAHTHLVVEAMEEYANQFKSQEEVVKGLINIRDALTEARNMDCVCSGFILQYEQGCQCEKQKKINVCEKALQGGINAL